MSDDGLNASADARSPTNEGAQPAVPTSVYSHNGRATMTPPSTNPKERDFVERPSRRPSFLENLADSRESQFYRPARSELERYFVRRYEKG